MLQTHPNLGFGLGLRFPHYPYIFENKPAVDWFEIVSENFMDTDGRPKRNLARIKELYPIVMHGVALSIGTVDPLNSEYLKKLKALIDWANPAWISDHLCWTGIAHKNTHDLLPVPYTEEALKHLIKRISQVQDYLGRPIALENPSTYLEFKHSNIPEAEFIAHMAQESGCNLLLDVNNVFVTCFNHRLSPKEYIDKLPLDKVIQIHLSGHSNKGTHIVDTHDDHVVDEVWNIYKYVVNKAGRIPNTMVEWDDNIPDFPVLLNELTKARNAAADHNNYVLPNLAASQVAQLLNQPISLANAQEHMQEAIMEGEKFNSNPANWIRSKEQFPAQEQLQVYVNAYRYRLYDTTAEDYPVLEHYLGKEKFQELLWDFVNTTRPDHFNIARYTTKLPDCIKAKLPDDIFAQEICIVETAITQLSDPLETEILEQKHLEGLTADSFMEIVLNPRKALELFKFNYPVNAYYYDVMEKGQGDVPQACESYLAIFRHEDTVWRMNLEKDEYLLLCRIFSGMKIGEAMEILDESAAIKISDWFSRWMRNGLLAA